MCLRISNLADPSLSCITCHRSITLHFRFKAESARRPPPRINQSGGDYTVDALPPAELALGPADGASSTVGESTKGPSVNRWFPLTVLSDIGETRVSPCEKDGTTACRAIGVSESVVPPDSIGSVGRAKSGVSPKPCVELQGNSED
jgi:hypothetical protein